MFCMCCACSASGACYCLPAAGQAASRARGGPVRAIDSDLHALLLVMMSVLF